MRAACLTAEIGLWSVSLDNEIRGCYLSGDPDCSCGANTLLYDKRGQCRTQFYNLVHVRVATNGCTAQCSMHKVEQRPYMVQQGFLVYVTHASIRPY